MRASDQVFAPTSDAENGQESEAFQPETADLPRDGSKLSNGTALAVPERDPERIAYQLWNEGRVDEAIAFLEREIAVERGRHRETALVPATGPDMRPVDPASDWRERHKTALVKADFNAFGTNVRTIDVTATPADAILAHGAKRRSSRTWIMTLVLAAGLGTAALALWKPSDNPQLAAVSDLTPESMRQEPVPVAKTAALTDPQDSADRAAGTPLPADSVAEVTEAPPPETEVVETPPPNPDALAELPPPPAGAAPAMPAAAPRGDTAATSAMTPLSARSPSEPQTTASIAPESSTEEQVVALEAPLPRPRPEPSPEIVAALNAPPAPEIVPEPTVTRMLGAPDVVPVYGPNGVRIYRSIRRPVFPQQLSPTDPFFRTSMTPAEYQALLERRAWAQHYAAQRRAGASPRIITLP
jgi:hypothetical protein